MIHSRLSDDGYGSEEDEVTYGYIQEIHCKRLSDIASAMGPNDNNDVKESTYKAEESSRINLIKSNLMISNNITNNLGKRTRDQVSNIVFILLFKI